MLSVVLTVLIISVFLISSSTLIGRLIVLEIFSFYLLFTMVVIGVFTLRGSYMILVFFVVFVLEGVVGIMSLVMLVSFVGRDYLRIRFLTLW